jgi:hypothetical protein
MAVLALLTSANLLFAQSSSSTAPAQKSEQSLLSDLTGSTNTSPRTAPDSYTPSLLGSLGGSDAGASLQSPYGQKTSAADALSAAVGTAQKDADIAALAAQQNPGLSKAAFSQLSQDMASLSDLMKENAASQSSSGNVTTTESIVITASSGAGSIAAIASDAANSSGNEETSSVAFVGADGQVMAAGQGSLTTSDGTTTAATAGFSVSAGSDASSNGQSAEISAYASVGVATQSDTTSSMQWVGVLVNAASGDTTNGSQSAASVTVASANVNSGQGSSSDSYASVSALIASGYQSAYSPGNWNSGSTGSVSAYA